MSAIAVWVFIGGLIAAILTIAYALLVSMYMCICIARIFIGGLPATFGEFLQDLFDPRSWKAISEQAVLEHVRTAWGHEAYLREREGAKMLKMLD